MSMQDSIQVWIDRFQSKVDSDEALRKELMPLKKTFNMDLGTEHYSMRLEEGGIRGFAPVLADGADVTIRTTPASLQALMDGTLRPMKAYITKKISVEGKIQDLLFLKKFF
ncbi:MAG: SCP2 sterol-binding domain-containing protein [Candidatus Methanoplasma sp.]|jgi:putative sterol carrier protein|nr:SCP2 sterol-binding domain-containing protein [Candidatus Methanoplasma sp.]